MKTLYDAVMTHGGANAPFVVNHLKASGIADWQDCTKVNLMDFVDHLQSSVCRSSAHTYAAILKAVLNRY